MVACFTEPVPVHVYSVLPSITPSHGGKDTQTSSHKQKCGLSMIHSLHPQPTNSRLAERTPPVYPNMSISPR